MTTTELTALSTSTTREQALLDAIADETRAAPGRELSPATTETEARATGSANLAPVGARVIRDRIVLTPAMVAGLNSSVPAGQTIVLVARELVVDAKGSFLSGVIFENHDVLIVADRLDARDGIWTTNTSVPGAGAPGGNGFGVQILCRRLTGAAVLAVGGSGGAGAKGAKGTNGEEICTIDTGTKPPLKICEWTPGGKGGPGGPGGRGGNGGAITVQYVEDLVPGGFKASSLFSIGGSGGAGGAGGAGGHSEPTNGPTGPKGPAGPAGAPLAATAQKIADFGFVLMANSLLGAQTIAEWRDLRLRAAEYYTRAFRPTGERAAYLGLARDEAGAVLQLAPTATESSRATAIVNGVLNNLNVLGIDRTSAPVPPDTARYIKELATYENRIVTEFRDATGGLLEVQFTEANVRQALQLQRAHLDSTFLKDKLANEVAAAQEAKKKAGVLSTDATTEVDDLKKRIKDLEFTISTGNVSGGITLADGLALGLGVAAGIAGTLIGGPAVGTIAGTVLPMALDLIGNQAVKSQYTSSLKDGQDVGAALKSLNTQFKGLSKGFNELAKNPAKTVNDWKDPTVKLVVSMTKIADDLQKAKPTGAPEYAQLHALNQQLFAATHKLLLAGYDLAQANFTVAAAQAGESLRVEDLTRVNQALTTLSANDRQIRLGVLAAVRNARSIRDRLLWRVFRAARAVDVYTLSYPPSSGAVSPFVDLNAPGTRVAYDFGHLPPDVEQDYLDGRLSHTQFKQLLVEATSMIESSDFAEARDKYRQRQPHGIVPGGTLRYPRLDRPAERAAVTAAFRKDAAFTVRLEPTDLFDTRHEAKVTGLRLVLSGAGAAAGAIQCRIRNSGRTRQRWLPGEHAVPPVIDQILPPTTDFLTLHPTGVSGEFAGAAVVTLPGEDQSLLLDAAGRGVAGEWTVEIEPGTGTVNLAGLTDVGLFIDYESFPTDPAPTQPGTPALPTIGQVSHAQEAVRPGTTVIATVDLAAPAPATGALVKLVSSDPKTVSVPGAIAVPAGATRVQIPMEVAANPAGAGAVITATGDVALRAEVKVIPGRPEKIDLGTRPGLLASVNGVAVDGPTVYATHVLHPETGPKGGGERGTVAVVTDGGGTGPKGLVEKPPRFGVGDLPRAAAINPDNDLLYVVNGGPASFNLSIMDQLTGKEVPGSPFPLGQGPIEVGVHRGTRRVFVSNWFAGKVHILEPVAGSKTREHRLAFEATLGRGPMGLGVDQEAGRAYVAQAFRSGAPVVHRVVAVDVNGKVVGVLAHPSVVDAVDVAVASVAGRTRVCVAVAGSPFDKANPAVPAVVVFDPATPAAAPVIVPLRSVPTAIETRGATAYVTVAGAMQVIDVAAGLVRMTVPTGPQPLGLALGGTSAVYVGDGRDGSLTRFDLPELGLPTSWS